MRKIKLLLLSFGLMLMASCVGPYTIEDSGKTIELSEDTPFEIELVGNPSTGYQWQVSEINEEVVKQIGKADYKTEDDRIGSAGKYTFHFQAVGQGECDLRLTYTRRFEPNAEPAKTFNLKVICGTMGRIEAE
jgi:inhibitor of cysteine peptidase